LQLLDSIETDAGKKQLLTKAHDNADKLARLISELLDVSKIQSGQLVLNVQPFKLEELLLETTNAMQLVFPSHQIINQVTGTDFEIRADQPRVEQVLINLLSNAVKYSAPGSRVLVDLHSSDTEYTVSVQDFGTGISDTEKESIFDRFYRAKDVSSNVTGFGLGLYICKNIIDRHQGKIWAEPQTDGTIFYFSLPKNFVEGSC
ncbi:MAG: histidine kinase, partial [Sphingobacteriales bacterium]